MLAALVTVFVLAYAAIALEHLLRINKSASALLAADILWAIYAVMGERPPAYCSIDLPLSERKKRGTCGPAPGGTNP
nr:hypothetical protein [Geotalea sp. SG265]